MRCQKCGEEMNHHADKLVEPVDESDREHVDPALGGMIQEAHACGRCGHAEFRIADVRVNQP
jgi:hypothetical protein